MDTLSEQIRAARKRAGLTQAELAAMVNIAQGDISKIERGQVNVRLMAIDRIARALNMDLIAVPRAVTSQVMTIIRDENEPIEDRILLDEYGVPDEN